MPETKNWRVADYLADALIIEGVTHIFGVPGESYLDFLDALFDRKSEISFVTARHEASAGNMAEGVAKMTGTLGVAAVTRGPGATHASIAIHTAAQDSTPMLLLIGQVPVEHMGKEAFQEIEYRHMFGHIAKGVWSIDRAEDAPQIMADAIRTAYEGRPGPVIIALPEDTLGVKINAARHVKTVRTRAKADPAPLLDMLAKAERPLVIAGGSLWTADDAQALQSFVERYKIPVALGFRRQDRLSAASDCYVGDVGFGVNPKLRERIKQADLLIAFGTRMGEIVTQSYTVPSLDGEPGQKIAHIHVSAAEINKVYKADLAIVAHPGEMAKALAASPFVSCPDWSVWCAEARADYLAWSAPTTNPGEVQIAEIWAWLRDNVPADTIVTNGAGNYAAWLHRFHRYGAPGSQLAPTSGAMGYGFPAAIGAKIVAPERMVIAAAGDGCFQMALPELATAMQEGANVITLVFNNGKLGTIRMHQEREYPGRVVGTGFDGTDFAAIAAAYGVHAEKVEKTADFAPAFERAVAAGRPALIEVMVPPTVISPTSNLPEGASS